MVTLHLCSDVFNEWQLCFPDSYRITLRCVADFVYNIANIAIQRRYYRSFLKLARVVTMEKTLRPLFPRTPSPKPKVLNPIPYCWIHLKQWLHWLIQIREEGQGLSWRDREPAPAACGFHSNSRRIHAAERYQPATHPGASAVVYIACKDTESEGRP